MIPTVAVVVMLVGVAGCCVYISYRVGQSISPTSSLLLRRLARVEARVARSETTLREALEHHREESGLQSWKILEESSGTVTSQVESLRRPIDDLGDRLNGVRVDIARDTRDLRDEVQETLESVRAGARQAVDELAHMHAGMLEKVASALHELGKGDERRHERAQAVLERLGSDLKGSYARSVADLRSALAEHQAAGQTTATGIEQRVAEQTALLERINEGIAAALRESTERQERLHTEVESQLAALRTDVSHQWAAVRAAGEQQVGAWHSLRDEFASLSKSWVQTTRAVDVLKNQLSVPLHDSERSAPIDVLLDRLLQPNEFARDVEIEPGSRRTVAFAVRLSGNPQLQVWLPIAALPSIDGYRAFVSAGVYGDAEWMNSRFKAFEEAIIAAARDLDEMFIAPPHTLNLGLLFVPADDLVEEIARRDDLVETLQRDCHVIVAGPATLPTLVMGLRAAFRGTTPRPVGRGAGNGVSDAPAKI